MRFKDIVEIEFQQDYYKQLHQFVENEYLHKTIFPPKENIFRKKWKIEEKRKKK